MTPSSDFNLLILAALIGVPLAIISGGPFAWRAMVILLGLGLFAVYPLIGLAVIVLYLLRRSIADFFIAFVAGLGGTACQGPASTRV
jgi:hypothetical protein